MKQVCREDVSHYTSDVEVRIDKRQRYERQASRNAPGSVHTHRNALLMTLKPI